MASLICVAAAPVLVQDSSTNKAPRSVNIVKAIHNSKSQAVELVKPAMAGVVGAAAFSAAMFPMEASALQYAELELSAPMVVEAEARSAKAFSPTVFTAPSVSAAPAAEGDEGDNTTSIAIGAAALFLTTTLAGLYVSQNSGGEAVAPAAVVSKPPTMEEFDAAVATARAAEAGQWIGTWRTKSQIAERTAEASAWIAAFRVATATREREACIEDRADWIATWRQATLERAAAASATPASSNPFQSFLASIKKAMKPAKA